MNLNKSSCVYFLLYCLR